MKLMLLYPNCCVLQKYKLKVTRNSNPIVYWQDKKTLYPILARLAAKYLSIPAASVASERLFSTANQIISDQRNSLNPERAEMLLFINKNLRLFTD